MRPERRHELATNELADWIGNFPNWIKENKGTVIYVAVALVLIGISAYLYYSPRQGITREQLEFTALTEQVETAKLQMAARQPGAPANPELLRSTAERLEGISDQLKSEQAEALALIKYGEAVRSEIHFSPKLMDAKAVQYQVDKAKKAYQEALDKGGDNVQIASLANFGLGISEEETGNFEEARKYYSKIADDANYAGTAGAYLATKRLGTISDYKGNFVFVEAPKAPVMKAAPEANEPNTDETSPAEQNEQAGQVKDANVQAVD